MKEFRNCLRKLEDVEKMRQPVSVFDAITLFCQRSAWRFFMVEATLFLDQTLIDEHIPHGIRALGSLPIQ